MWLAALGESRVPLLFAIQPFQFQHCAPSWWMLPSRTRSSLLFLRFEVVKNCFSNSEMKQIYFDTCNVIYSDQVEVFCVHLEGTYGTMCFLQEGCDTQNWISQIKVQMSLISWHGLCVLCKYFSSFYVVWGCANRHNKPYNLPFIYFPVSRLVVQGKGVAHNLN